LQPDGLQRQVGARRIVQPLLAQPGQSPQVCQARLPFGAGREARVDAGEVGPRLRRLGLLHHLDQRLGVAVAEPQHASEPEEATEGVVRTEETERHNGGLRNRANVADTGEARQRNRGSGRLSTRISRSVAERAAITDIHPGAARGNSSFPGAEGCATGPNPDLELCG